jgi:hypothetical protein
METVQRLTNVDYQKCIMNFHKHIKHPLEEIVGEGNVDVYASTYYSEKSEDIIRDYNLKGHYFEPHKPNPDYYLIHKGLQVILDSKIDYDIAVSVRFDLDPFITKDLVNKILQRKMYIYPWKECYAPNPDRTYYWRDHNRVANAFTIFHGSLLQTCLTSLDNTHMHYRDLIKHIPVDQVGCIIQGL